MISSKVLWLKALVVTLAVAFLYLYYSHYVFDIQIMAVFGLILVFLMPNQSPWQFVKDWWWLVAGVYVHIVLRGFVDDWSPWLHGVDVAQFERSIFGTLPSEWLQSVWFHDPSAWHNIILFYFHLSFFIFPLVALYLVWVYRHAWYRRFAVSFLTVGLVGVIIFYLMPLEPPWLLGMRGELAVGRIMFEIADYGGISHTLVNGVVTNVSPNIVAAMPSMHVAWPLLAALFLISAFGRRAVASLLVPAGIALAVVYFGEHYVLDVVASGILVTVVWLAQRWWSSNRHEWGA